MNPETTELNPDTGARRSPLPHGRRVVPPPPQGSRLIAKRLGGGGVRITRRADGFLAHAFVLLLGVALIAGSLAATSRLILSARADGVDPEMIGWVPAIAFGQLAGSGLLTSSRLLSGYSCTLTAGPEGLSQQSSSGGKATWPIDVLAGVEYETLPQTDADGHTTHSHRIAIRTLDPDRGEQHHPLLSDVHFSVAELEWIAATLRRALALPPDRASS